MKTNTLTFVLASILNAAILSPTLATASSSDCEGFFSPTSSIHSGQMYYFNSIPEKNFTVKTFVTRIRDLDESHQKTVKKIFQQHKTNFIEPPAPGPLVDGTLQVILQNGEKFTIPFFSQVGKSLDLSQPLRTLETKLNTLKGIPVALAEIILIHPNHTASWGQIMGKPNHSDQDIIIEVTPNKVEEVFDLQRTLLTTQSYETLQYELGISSNWDLFNVYYRGLAKASRLMKSPIQRAPLRIISIDMLTAQYFAQLKMENKLPPEVDADTSSLVFIAEIF